MAETSNPPARTLIPFPEIRLEKAKDWEKFTPRGGEEELFHAVPLFTDSAAAGPAREIDETKIEGWVLAHSDLMKGHRPGNVVAIRVKGDSMNPVIPSGSIVAVDISRRQITWRGQKLALVSFEGDVTVKLVRPLPRAKIEISAYNSEVWPTQESSLSQAEIRGTVVWWWAPAK